MVDSSKVLILVSFCIFTPIAYSLNCHSGTQEYDNQQLQSTTVEKINCGVGYDYCAWQAKTNPLLSNSGYPVQMNYYCASEGNTKTQGICQREGCYASNDNNLNIITCCCKGDYCNNSSVSKFAPLATTLAIVTYLCTKLL